MGEAASAFGERARASKGNKCCTDSASERDLFSSSTGKGRPLAVGFGRDLPLADRTIAGGDLPWQPVAGGGHVARIDVESQDAAAVRIALAITPDHGIALRFTGSDVPQPVFGPFDATAIARDVDAHGSFWSPVLEGSTASIEIHLPAAMSADGLELRLLRVSHLVVAGTNLRTLDPKLGIGQSGSCEIDVACVVPQTQALLDVAKSVARILFTKEDGLSYVCTATLLNDARTSFTPYLLSASHCLDSQTAAATLNAYWFFDAVACNSQTVPNYIVQAGGAKLLARSDDWDWSLVQLNTPPPAGVTFSAWRAEPLSAAQVAMAVAHHPRGDLKKWSQGTTQGLRTFSDGSSFVEVRYNQGSTEAGSSGAALLTLSPSGGYYEVRGGLFGGDASCTNTLGFDVYSRLDIARPLIGEYLTPDAENPSAVAPVVEFYNSFENDYLITIDRNEIANLDNGVPSGWVRTGLRFLAYTNPALVPATARAVCRLYTPPPYGNTHFQSASRDECAAMLSQSGAHWTLQKAEAFFIHVPDASGSCPANTRTVYRLRSNVNAPHRRYTTEIKVRNNLALSGQWTIEGTTMCAPLDTMPVTMMALSRKTHAAAGRFDLPLSQVASAPTTESRVGSESGQHDIVFHFDKQVTGGTAALTEGNAAIGTPSFNGNEMTVPVIAAADAQYVSIVATNVTLIDGSARPSISIRIGLLQGDVDGSRAVTLSDLLLLNAVLTQAVTAQTFRHDVNASGAFTLSDVLQVNARLARALPAP